MSAARVSKPQPAPVPSLESGDVMSRAEFHARYLQHPEIKNAELIEGVVFVSSPRKAKGHGFEEGLIGTWLGVYQSISTGVALAHNSTLLLDLGNEVQPDLLLMRLSGGSARLRPDGYVEGPPELVVEIAGSSVSRDLHQKKSAYERNRVQEYLVWRVEDAAIDWFALEDGRYTSLTPDEDDVIESRVFPGLKLNVAALLLGDLAVVLAALQSPPKD